MCPSKNMRRTSGGLAAPGGFTLIELLVVMAILASLAAILVPIIASGRRMAKINASKNLLAQIEHGIERFTEQCGYGPPDKIPSGAPAKKFVPDATGGTVSEWSGFPGPTTSAEALYYCLANPYVMAPVQTTAPLKYAAMAAAFLELQADKECVDSDNDGIPEIVDRWGQPFEYHRKAYLAGAAMPTVFRGVASLAAYDDGVDPKYNKDGYDLWSPGPVGYTGVDWITNWK